MNKEMTKEELHSVLLDIMTCIDEFCEKNNIRYSLGGGSLLGAIRHKGFIPWDDDLDIMMPRPDYDRFKKLFNGYNSNYRFIYAEKSDTINSPLPFGKVCDVRTKVLEGRSPLNKSGVYVDVFPIDGMPTNVRLCKFFLKCVNQFVQALYYKNLEYADLSTIISKLKKILFSFWSYKQLGSCINSISSLFNYNNAKFAGAVTGVYGMKERYRKEIFDFYIKVPFENKNFYIIADFEEYLKQHYNNYMEIPPKHKQINHDITAWWII